jgi:hypothetical protein
MTRPRGKRQLPCLWPRPTGKRAPRELLDCLWQEALVGKRIVGLAAIAQNDVIDDVDAEELSGVHQALGQDAVFLAGLRRPRRMVMAAEQGRGIAQDGGLHNFTRMDHAGGQRAHRHGVDADHLVLLVQHGDQEVFAVHLAEVLAEEDRGIPGAAELGLRVRQTALPYQW